MIRVAQVRPVRTLRLRRLVTPMEKAATKAFHREMAWSRETMARRCRFFISCSKRVKRMRDTSRDSPRMKKARTTTRGL
ncbi:hypothetical protein DSECCO2_636510 [anaerobic digester metagenome]